MIPEILVNDSTPEILVGRHIYTSTRGVTVFLADLEADQRRSATIQGLARFARLTDTLETGDELQRQ